MLGENIKSIIRRWNITEEGLAQLTYVNRGKISSYKRGAAKPDIDFFIRLEEICEYNFTIRELYEEEIDFKKIPLAPVLNSTNNKKDNLKESKRYRFNRALKDIGEIVGGLLEEEE